MKIFIWVLYLCPVLLIAQNQTVIPVDHFDRFPVNEFNQQNTGFFNETATIKLQTVRNTQAFGLAGHSLAIEYQVEEAESFCGVTFPLNNLNLSEVGYLSFWIKGTNTGEYLSAEMTATSTEDEGTVSGKVAIWDYLSCGPSEEWQKVNIPMDAFWNLQNRDDVLRLTFVFENFQSVTNQSPLHSTVYIDDILFGTKSLGYVKLDGFEDILKSNATGGNIGEFSQNNNPENYTSELVINSVVGCDYDLYIQYNNEAGDEFGGVFFILGGKETGWEGSEKSMVNYDSLKLRLRAENEQTNPGNIKLELKSNSRDTTHTYRLIGISTVSQEFAIPLTGFTPSLVDQTVGQLVIVFERNVQNVAQGNIFLEDVTFISTDNEINNQDQFPQRPEFITINGEAGSVTVPEDEVVEIATTVVFDAPAIESAFLEYFDGCEWIRFHQQFVPLVAPLKLSFPSSKMIPNRQNQIRMGVENCHGNTSYSDLVELTVNVPGILTAEELFRNAYELFRFLRTETGLYNDAAVFEGEQFHPVSVATTGMGLIALCIADSMEWESDAELLVIETLEAVLGLRPGLNPDRNALGWFRHFIDAQTGARAWNSEYSSVDSGILTAGALFCKKYFSDNGTIAALADSLCGSILWESMIKDANSGAIYLTADEEGRGGEYAALPYNEYMLVAWLATNDPRDTDTAALLWDNFFFTTENLPKVIYDGYEMLTDGPGRFLSGFIPQFSYYLCHPFTDDEQYQTYFLNHMKADQRWWDNNTNEACYVWGFGAGSANDWVESGYHADDIGNQPGTICSPHIIAGAIPVFPESLDHLLQIANDPRSKYTLPESNKTVLWRFSAEDPSWRAGDIQGVDYATFLFGLAAHPDFLGRDFFHRNNDFDFPEFKDTISSASLLPKELVELEVSPNPFTDVVNLDLELSEAALVGLTVYELTGRILYREGFGRLYKGVHQLSWNIGTDIYHKISSGMVILQLEIGNGRVMRKLVKAEKGR